MGGHPGETPASQAQPRSTWAETITEQSGPWKRSLWQCLVPAAASVSPGVLSNSGLGLGRLLGGGDFLREQGRKEGADGEEPLQWQGCVASEAPGQPPPWGAAPPGPGLQQAART